MSFDWLAWSNPVAVWWSFLLVVSAANIALWLLVHRHSRRLDGERDAFLVKLMVALCAAYVFGCAFRSVLPRADVQRICLFNTWLSSVMIGRTVATIAEVCFAAQWVIIMGQLGRITGADTTVNASLAILPLIVIAECFSSDAVLTRN